MNQPILKREGIEAQLQNIFNYPLTVVVAAMGYGKTTSVKNFLEEAKANYAWLFVEDEEDSPQYIWDSLTRQLAKTEPALGNQLNDLGFPIDVPQRDRVIGIIADYAYATNIVLVIDDYYLAHSPKLDQLMERLVRSEISGLHLVIISRTRPDLNIEELRLKGYCCLLKNDLFQLSKREIKDYFKLFGQDISEDISGQIHSISEGWITVVYLIIQRYCETGSLEPGSSIESLIETAVISRYQPAEVRLLLSLCIFDSFTPKQAIYLTSDTATARMIHRLSENNSLIRYDERTGIYKMHHIFRGYLRKELEEQLDRVELQKLYKRAAEWHIQNGDLLLGFKEFLKAGEYDLILEEFEKTGITKEIDRYPRAIVELFEQIPEEVKYRHPIGYVTYADFYLTDIDMEGGANLLQQIEGYYQDNSDISPELKKRILGEIEFSRSVVFFNDGRKMHENHKKARELLNGSSIIANKDMMFTFGSPHLLYLYYREKGKLRWTMEYMGETFPYYSDISNGCGTGSHYLLQAEYYLETADFKLVEPYARKTIYKAETMDQLSIIICANLTLARLYAAQGKFGEALEIIYNLKAEAMGYNSPILGSAVDLCAGYIGGIIGEPQSFAGWLSSGDMQQSEILFQGMAFNYIIYAKYLLLEGNYLKLEVLCEEMQQLLSMFNNLMGYLHVYILDAVAQYKLYGLEKAKTAIVPAIEIGRADGIILPFAEYCFYILDILKAMLKESGNDEYLDRLIREADRYYTNMKLFNSEKTTAGELTEREREILQLVAHGQTNREIAAGLYIAEITVRKNITSIYRKLEVDGRAAAVKKAVELKLT